MQLAAPSSASAASIPSLNTTQRRTLLIAPTVNGAGIKSIRSMLKRHQRKFKALSFSQVLSLCIFVEWGGWVESISEVISSLSLPHKKDLKDFSVEEHPQSHCSNKVIAYSAQLDMFLKWHLRKTKKKLWTADKEPLQALQYDVARHFYWLFVLFSEYGETGNTCTDWLSIRLGVQCIIAEEEIQGWREIRRDGRQQRNQDQTREDDKVDETDRRRVW